MSQTFLLIILLWWPCSTAPPSHSRWPISPLREGQGMTLEQGPLAPAMLHFRSVAFGGTEFVGQIDAAVQ